MKEKYEELQVDMDIMKAEIADDSGVASGVDGESAKTTNFEMKQLQAQVSLFLVFYIIKHFLTLCFHAIMKISMKTFLKNEKLRETLVKMRDLSAHEKSELMRLTKDLEEKQGQNTELTKLSDKLKTQNEELEATINDLQEQVAFISIINELTKSCFTLKCLT